MFPVADTPAPSPRIIALHLENLDKLNVCMRVYLGKVYEYDKIASDLLNG